MSEITLIEETADVVANFVSNNAITIGDLPALITSVYQSFATLGKPVEEFKPAPPKATSAQIKKSMTSDALISFEDGKSYKSLKRHLSTKGMTPAEYKAKWGLPRDYPMVAPSYSAQRSELAKTLGLGRKPALEPVAEPAKRAPTRRKKAA